MILNIFCVSSGERLRFGLFNSISLGCDISLCVIVSICCCLFDKVFVCWVW